MSTFQVRSVNNVFLALILNVYLSYIIAQILRIAVETFSQLLPRATALAYSAGHNDFDSMNNFAKGEESGEGSKILDATKEVIGDANVQLKKAVSLLT